MGKKFTLIELLLVIAIIAILSSMLLPALSRARAAAQSVKCVSNQKQFMLGIIMYADTYKGEIPDYYVAEIDKAWTWLLLDFDAALLDAIRCPARSIDYANADWRLMETYGLVLGLDGMFFHFENAVKKGNGYPAAEPFYGKSLSAIAFLGDSIKIRSGKFQQWPVIAPNLSIGDEGLHDLRHSRRTNMGFLDGHVETQDRGQLKDMGLPRVAIDFNSVEL